MATQAIPRVRWSGERRFYTGMALAILVTVYVGFARSFFLRPLFPTWPSPPETIFYVHGAGFTAWFVLLVAQASLVAAGRTDVHRKLGGWGVVLAAGMVVLGVLGALTAARRPAGFRDVLAEVKRLGGHPVGLGVLIDRSQGNLEFGVPQFTCLRTRTPTYKPEECPLCREGKPLAKPGSGESLPG